MPQIKPQIALLAIAIVAALIIIGIVQQQQQQPRVIVIKPSVTPTTTAAPPPPSAPQQAPIFACNSALYKDNNVTVCGVLYVDQQYVYAKSGWVSGGPIIFGSDVSSCVFQLEGQMLQFNCQQVIAIRR